MRLRILTPVLAFSILLIFGCAEEKPASVMPVTTDSELALELYQTGMVAHDQLKEKLAWQNLYMAVEQDSEFFMAYFWMYYMSGKESKKLAEKAFQCDVQLNPGEEQARKALKYLVEGQEEKVVEHLQNLVEMYPADPYTHKILYLLQHLYFKDNEAAIITLERAIRECPDYAFAYNILGYAYMELEQYDEAEKAFDQYIKAAPDLANPYDSKGDFYMTTKQFEKAFDSYMKAFEIDSAFTVSEKKAKKAKQMLEKMSQ